MQYNCPPFKDQKCSHQNNSDGAELGSSCWNDLSQQMRLELLDLSQQMRLELLALTLPLFSETPEYFVVW